MYKHIINPATGRKVRLYGRIGKQIIRNYVLYLDKQAGGMGLLRPLALGAAALGTTTGLDPHGASTYGADSLNSGIYGTNHINYHNNEYGFEDRSSYNPYNPDDVYNPADVPRSQWLHDRYQVPPYTQAKLVRVVKGAVQDVVVDVRPGSKTYGQFFSIELSEENKTQLFIPRGLAHGFLALEDTTVFSYKCDNFYNKESEKGLIYNDSTLNIDWQFPIQECIISEKDQTLPEFKSAKKVW